ncbi:hypothetical protein IQ215_08915 [Cyanobacterium stanieri LEGE 03274]|uniref:Conjugal transfer protein TrbI n=1 Tax=Cyanobacterium stanieri LEGE 03274 TaxID=1828756 RepID=A0ABR9V6U7_9CHRO|nr:hypothetical protein [Cyanobacterium stanieri]MBE9222816.1 hypothetical protein [Cyanobacterium stanieri LEGE 03274]
MSNLTSKKVFSFAKSKSIISLALCMGMISSTGITSVAAQSSNSRHFRNESFPGRGFNPNQNNRPIYNNNGNISQQNGTLSLPTGTNVPTYYAEDTSATKIYVTREETLPLTLTVDRDIRDNRGNIVIPVNSRIEGEIRPANRSRGSLFVGRTIIYPNGTRMPINVESNVVTRTEVIERGGNSDSIWQGALAGAAAATLISGVTGNRVISTEKVLGGAGLGALAGLFLRERPSSVEVISFDTRRDLNLTLRSSLSY